MKELTDEQVIDAACGVFRCNFTSSEAYDLRVGRAAIAADRALNAPADRDVIFRPSRAEYPGPLDANALEIMAKLHPDEMFLKGSGVQKLINAIRQLEREIRSMKSTAQPADRDVMQQAFQLEPYDAGYLNDFGGGNVGWWQDYMRAELARAHDFYQSQVDHTPPAEQPEGPARTGWPEGMLQDDSRELSKALASKPNARAEARSAAEQQGEVEYPAGEVVGPCVCGSWPGGKCFKCPKIEQQGEQRPVGWFQNTGTDADPLYEQIADEFKGEPDAIALYTHPSPTLAELRAKVGALPLKVGSSSYSGWEIKAAVLAEIDKMGGKV